VTGLLGAGLFCVTLTMVETVLEKVLVRVEYVM
jgi:hypothetical protein